jgi:hypothetical protein
VGAQSYFNALATMLQHTRGVLLMTSSASKDKQFKLHFGNGR